MDHCGVPVQVQSGSRSVLCVGCGSYLPNKPCARGECPNVGTWAVKKEGKPTVFVCDSHLAGNTPNVRK